MIINIGKKEARKTEYLLSAFPNCFVEEYGPLIEEHRKQFHVPVDSYIIDQSWPLKEDDKKTVALPLKDDKTKRDREYKTPSSYVKAWSQWGNETYKNFQESLRNALDEAPIDWEGPAWIEQAKKRNRKTDKEKE